MRKSYASYFEMWVMPIMFALALVTVTVTIIGPLLSSTASRHNKEMTVRLPQPQSHSSLTHTAAPAPRPLLTEFLRADHYRRDERHGVRVLAPPSWSLVEAREKFEEVVGE